MEKSFYLWLAMCWFRYDASYLFCFYGTSSQKVLAPFSLGKDNDLTQAVYTERDVDLWSPVFVCNQVKVVCVLIPFFLIIMRIFFCSVTNDYYLLIFCL